jgi:hypothetical protein
MIISGGELVRVALLFCMDGWSGGRHSSRSVVQTPFPQHMMYLYVRSICYCTLVSQIHWTRSYDFHTVVLSRENNDTATMPCHRLSSL